MTDDMRMGRPSRFGQQIDRLLSGAPVEQAVERTRDLVREVREGLDRITARVAEQGESAEGARRDLSAAIESMRAEMDSARSQVAALGQETVRALREDVAKAVEGVVGVDGRLETLARQVEEPLGALRVEVRQLASRGGVDGVVQTMQEELARKTQQISIRLDAVEQAVSQVLLEIRDNTARFAAGETEWIGALSREVGTGVERSRVVEEQVRALEESLTATARDLSQAVTQAASRSRRELRDLTGAIEAGTARMDDVVARLDVLAGAQERLAQRLGRPGRSPASTPSPPQAEPKAPAPVSSERPRLLRRLVRRQQRQPVAPPSVASSAPAQPEGLRESVAPTAPAQPEGSRASAARTAPAQAEGSRESVAPTAPAQPEGSRAAKPRAPKKTAAKPGGVAKSRAATAVPKKTAAKPRVRKDPPSASA